MCQEKGTKVVGIYCTYCPRELVLAAGAIPVGLCGTRETPIQAAERDLPRNLCPLEVIFCASVLTALELSTQLRNATASAVLIVNANSASGNVLIIIKKIRVVSVPLREYVGTQIHQISGCHVR